MGIQYFESSNHFTFFVIVCCSLLLMIFLWTNSDNIGAIPQPRKYFQAAHSEYKYILTWSEAYNDPFYGSLGGFEAFRNCPIDKCYITNNRKHFGKNKEFLFDAIMFHQRSLSMRDMPDRRKRRLSQRYIHWSFETPAYSFHDLTDLKYLSRVFNLSMSYRSDSDIPVPYGHIQKTREHPPPGEQLNKIIRDFGNQNQHLYKQNQTANIHSPVAWLVSSCKPWNNKNKRDLFVKKLQK